MRHAPSWSAPFAMDKTVSRNFSIAKVLAIVIVVADHWFKDSSIWILSNISLFIFAFSSSFFTGRLYGVDVDTGAFWKKKLRRLGVRYWMVLALLALLLILQGRDVFHWHSLVHIAGLSGILNLFGPSQSALGRGLWFFTLLLFFYALYPVLARHLVASTRATVLVILATVGLLILDRSSTLGFALWPTMLAFILGIYAGVNRLRLSARALNAALVATPVLIAVLNLVLGIREFNGPLLVAFALALSLRLSLPGLPLGALRVLVALEACLLEIYLIHGYLFIRPTGIELADFAISLAFIVCVAMLLNIAGNKLVARIFDKKPADPAPAALCGNTPPGAA